MDAELSHYLLFTPYSFLILSTDYILTTLIINY
jgi:hypothetical protein